MTIFYETANFIIRSVDHPLVDRREGGHIKILPKVWVSDRTRLSPKLAIEYMKLSMVAGEALKTVLTKRGVEIGIINYQDMGNWSVLAPEGPHLEMHIFGRAKTATKQKYGDAVFLPHKESGFYDGFQSVDEEDMRQLKGEIERLLKTPKYSSF